MIEELVGWFRNPILLLLRNLYACEWFSFRVNSFQSKHIEGVTNVKGVQFPHEQNFDQTGFNPNTPRVLPRYRVTADLHSTTAYSNLQQEYKNV